MVSSRSCSRRELPQGEIWRRSSYDGAEKLVQFRNLERHRPSTLLVKTLPYAVMEFIILKFALEVVEFFNNTLNCFPHDRIVDEGDRPGFPVTNAIACEFTRHFEPRLQQQTLGNCMNRPIIVLSRGVAQLGQRNAARLGLRCNTCDGAN